MQLSWKSSWGPKKAEPRVRAVSVHRLSISFHSYGTGLALYRVVALTNQFRSGQWRHVLGAAAAESCISELHTAWRGNLKGKHTVQVVSDWTRSQYSRTSPLYVWNSLKIGYGPILSVTSPLPWFWVTSTLCSCLHKHTHNTLKTDAENFCLITFCNTSKY